MIHSWKSETEAQWKQKWTLFAKRSIFDTQRGKNGLLVDSLFNNWLYSCEWSIGFCEKTIYFFWQARDPNVQDTLERGSDREGVLCRGITFYIDVFEEWVCTETLRSVTTPFCSRVKLYYLTRCVTAKKKYYLVEASLSKQK